MNNKLTEPVDCACVIHGDAYSWDYVEKLYNMLNRYITPGIRLHVYTEASRPVPSHMIKHVLDDWSLSGSKSSWWYKIQLFDTKHFCGPLLYFDLDVVITSNIDWICQLPLEHCWTARDFKYLWRPTAYNINSSIMWWHTHRYYHVYESFIRQNLQTVVQRYHGDQDFIMECIPQKNRRFLDIDRIKSWRWEALDGGYNFNKRVYYAPKTGTNLTPATSVLVFHGNPKPDQIDDPVIAQYWQ
jgi:hypothetical protein